MQRLPSGFAVACAASVAAHVAVVAATWPGTAAVPAVPPATTPTVIVARLLTVAPLPPVPTSLPQGPAAAAVPPPEVAPEAPPVVPLTGPVVSSPADAQPPETRSEAAAPAMASSSPSAALDHGPRPLDDINPEFPPAAGMRGGSVTLRLVVSALGVVEEIAVVRSSPPGLFDDAALAAFAHARFAPGSRGGIAVRSEVVYEVEFAPLGRGTDTAGRTY